jgi:hypothetical protein
MVELVSTVEALVQRVGILNAQQRAGLLFDRSSLTSPTYPLWQDVRAAVASIPQTKVWVAVWYEDHFTVLQAELAAYDIRIVDYPRQRHAMHEDEVIRLVHQWGRKLAPEHLAYTHVRYLAKMAGVEPNEDLVVFGIGWPFVTKATISNNLDA